MAKRRLYIPPPVDPARPLQLERNRAHYLTRVLRLRRGDEIECFDGTGRSWLATFTDASARSATLEPGRRLADEPEPDPRLHLVQGLLKGASMDLVVQKATELAATDLWPIMAERSNVAPDPARLQRKRDHWQRMIESAAEQCGAVHLPRLHDIRDLPAFLASPPQAELILLDPDGPPLSLHLPRTATALLIGPEGGWSGDERRQAMHRGARSFSLGERILRAETAPLVALAALRHGWGWR